MNVWIVAAAAGAGYVAQRWKSRNVVQARGKDLKGCTSRGMMSRKIVDEDGYRMREQASEDTMVDVASIMTISGLSGNLGMLDMCGSCNMRATSNYTTGSPNDKCLHVDRGEDQVGGKINVAEYDVSLQPYITDVRFSYSLKRNGSCLRSNQTIEHLIKPLCYLDSPSSTQMFRPFVVADGSRIISRESGDFFSTPTGAGSKKLQKDVILQGNGEVFGVPRLPNIESPRKAKANRENGHSGSFSRKTNVENCHSQGSSHGAFLVCLGISAGIFSSFLAHKKEVDKLNGLLKQTENLVQDLQEELEMRDSLTVKELATGDYESQDTHNSSYNNELLRVFSPRKKLNNSSKHRAEEYHCRDSEGESISKIEAELEAELERLEFNINSFKLEDEYSDLDPEFIPDLAEGELRADVFNWRTDHQPYADQDGSGNSTPHSANYAVSPKELSLRLHQVIKSQLEERVRELEMALKQSQRKVRYMEVQHSYHRRVFSNSEAEESSTQGSPVAKDRPVVINLAGEALNAYNEVFEEFSTTNESEDDVIASGIGKINHQDNMNQHDHDVDWIESSMLSDDNDEMDRMLIKRILEKARKGSPAVLNAQKALFSGGENEHW
ncbi:PREDICTED: uncharacterized protein LOC109162806 isoform X2 [Ipomoea nil]|uniref:uncharacterized protein LOC109162806 isoform X2 n=1 Tax=Ipomoea nil TaxID=35883 RepID=UPI000900C583|nr:PREDICTED: uncharacterized protein LOC109162806 isoform X2 [Ipomoea nil]